MIRNMTEFINNLPITKVLTNHLGDEDITWITVNGRHIPIKEGQSVEDAMKSSKIPTEGQKNWEKSKIKVGDKSFNFYKNPAFEKPSGGTTLYHESNDSAKTNILKGGIEPGRDGTVWFVSQDVYAHGVKEGYKSDITFKVVIPKSDDFPIEKSSQGIQIEGSVPVKYIEGYVMEQEKD